MIRITQSPVKTAYGWYERRLTVDLAPDYQRRGKLWRARSKSYLVDSMINGFDVPKLYVADLSLLPDDMGASGMNYAVIDGRQRLETLFEWFDGSLRLAKDFIFRRDPTREAAGMNSHDLASVHPDMAAAVENFHLDVMQVVADSRDEITQLFIRLNQSKPLTGAETRNAMEGVAPAVIRELAKHEFFKDRIAFSVDRGGDQNTAAKVLLMESAGEFVDVKRRRLDLFVRDIAEEVDKSNVGKVGLRRAAASARSVFDDMTEVFRTHDPLLRSQGQVPVYYWLIRDLGPADGLRRFLVDFESMREANRKRIGEVGTSGNIDRELLRYDQFNRSVNDQHSLRGRFEILSRWWGRSAGDLRSASAQPKAGNAV